MMKTLALIGAASLAALAPSRAEPPAAPEASIPFVNHGGIRTFDAVGNDTLYIQDAHGRWYRADLMGYCPDLPYALSIGFDTRGPDTLDRYSTLIVSGQRCPIKSLVESGPPPKKH